MFNWRSLRKKEWNWVWSYSKMRWLELLRTRIRDLSVGCMVLPWCCLFQHRLPVTILIRLLESSISEFKSRQFWQCALKAWAFFRLVQTSPFFTWKTEMTSECQAGSSSTSKVQSNKSAVHLVTIFTSYLRSFK